MSRTKKPFQTEHESRDVSFKKLDVTGYYSNMELVIPEAEREYYAELEKVPLQPSFWSRSVWNGPATEQPRQRDYSYDNLQKVNRAVLDRLRPELSVAVRHAMSQRTYSFPRDEATKFSIFMLNEFLAQNEFTVYKDFLDEKWDDLFEDARQSRITMYPHTEDVYKHYNPGSPFVFRWSNTKKLQSFLQEETKDNLLRYIAKDPTSVDNKSIGIFFTNSRLELEGKIERPMSRQEATNQLMRAFSASLLSGGLHSNLDLTKVYKSFTEISEELNSRIADDSINYTTAQFPPNDLGKIGTYLEENAKEFTFAEMFFVIYALSNPKIFMRSGTVSDVSQLFLAFVEMDNSLELMKMVGQLGLGYNKLLPTAVQWKKALANGELDFVFEPSTTVLLVAASDDPATTTQILATRRALFGKKL